jgi:hypothetical protein
MGMIEDDLNKAMAASLGSFSEKAYRQAMALMNESEVSVTGDTAEKIKVQFENMAGEITAHVDLEYPVSAALTQARRYYAKKASIADLTQWILNVGLDKFRYVPGYERGNLPSQDRQARRIAWGMKHYKGANRKREGIKQWLHLPFFQLWKVYREEVINKYFAITASRTHEVLQDALGDQS